jgi:hypothetical protein
MRELEGARAESVEQEIRVRELKGLTVSEFEYQEVITDKEVAQEEAKIMEEQVKLRNVNLEKLRA